jgi:hypothetical protein
LRYRSRTVRHRQGETWFASPFTSIAFVILLAIFTGITLAQRLAEAVAAEHIRVVVAVGVVAADSSTLRLPQRQNPAAAGNQNTPAASASPGQWQRKSQSRESAAER